MDHNAIVEEIVKRVAAKISEAEGCSSPCGDKPGLLILTQDNADVPAALDSAALKARYSTECALARRDEVDLDAYEAVVLFGLSCGALAALAAGTCDTAYTRLASKAILSGKKVYVPTEEVELYQFKETAPAAYYNMMQQKLDLLVASGVVICAQASLEQVILGGETSAPVAAAAPASADAVPVCTGAAPAPVAPCAAPKQLRIDKRVLTEKDLIEANMNGVTCLCVGEKTIITALAQDAAKDRGMTIVRDEDE